MLLHAAAPKHVSFLAFCGANVLIDIEALYYLTRDQYPFHRFFHTPIGACTAIATTVALFILARWTSRHVPLPNVLRWKKLTLRPVVIGAVLGGVSHVILDSIMHADMRPLAPFTDANVLHQFVSVHALHRFCVVTGLVGCVMLGLRGVLRVERNRIRNAEPW